MTQEYLTPEGKADIMLFGINRFNDQTKKTEKVYVTDYDGTYPAKCQGIFDQLYIPNDMALVVEALDKYMVA